MLAGEQSSLLPANGSQVKPTGKPEFWVAGGGLPMEGVLSNANNDD